MKVLLLSISLKGGGGGAAYRLHQSLQNIGVSSQVLIQEESSDDIANSDRTVISLNKQSLLLRLLSKLRAKLNKRLLNRYPNRDRTATFYPQSIPDAIPSQVKQLSPDLVSLHWICSDYLSIESISKFNKPLVWTLHDMWPFTGGCVHSEDCDRYINSCGNCPLLNSGKEKDLSSWIWGRKAKAWKDLNLTIVTPSNWLAECARSSSLFRDRRIEVIPHGLDTKIFKPIDRTVARTLLNLPQDKQIVLFIAWMDLSWKKHLYYKGFDFLLSALQILSKSHRENGIEVVFVGFAKPQSPINVGFKSHYLGRFSDSTSLATVYSSADVMVMPSVRESFGQTASEALACGTPVVAFNTDNGLKDIVDHQQNGYLAKAFDVQDLAQGIAWVLEDRDRLQQLSNSARKKAEREYTLELYGERYRDLFNEVLENRK